MTNSAITDRRRCFRKDEDASAVRRTVAVNFDFLNAYSTIYTKYATTKSPEVIFYSAVPNLSRTGVYFYAPAQSSLSILDMQTIKNHAFNPNNIDHRLRRS